MLISFLMRHPVTFRLQRLQALDLKERPFGLRRDMANRVRDHKAEKYEAAGGVGGGVQIMSQGSRRRVTV